MTLVLKEDTHFFSSSTDLGAINKDNNGSRFSVSMRKPISVPKGAVDVKLECISANIWFTTPNIEDIYNNNHVYLFYDDGLGNTGTFDLEIPKGLYSISQLNTTIQTLLSQEQIPGSTNRFPCNSIVFSGNTATQRVTISLLQNLVFITDNNDPLYPNNIAYTLGFDGPNPLVATFSGQTFTAQSVARLNRINSYLLHSDIVKNGISVNSKQANILTEIQLDVQPGKLLTYRPYLPYKLDGNHLIESDRDLLTFWLTNEKNEYVDTNGEDFSFSLIVSYKINTDHIMTRGRNPVATAPH